jgi:Tfp pilus assembly protein FimT
MSKILTSRFFHQSRYPVTCRLKFAFTLIEVMVVLGIVMLLVGISFNFIGRLPAGLVLQSTSAGVDGLLVSARNRALLQGKRIDLSFNRESHTLSLGTIVLTESEDLQDQEDCATFDSIKRRKGDTYQIPSNVEVEFSDQPDDDAPVFRFFPDGTAVGGDIRLSIKQRTVLITVSQLTGIVSIRDEDD